MTQLNSYLFNNEYDELKALLIKNLPPYIKAGNEKETANIFSMPTIQALKSCSFINFNSEERISFMIFDFDTYKGEMAINAFKHIDTFYDYLNTQLGIEPTYITQTNKGFHFAYHLKNHVFRNSKNSMNYLNNIKAGIIEKMGCDIHGSSRNNGVWRNPLMHDFYYSGQYNYELNDFKDFTIYSKSPQQRFKRDITIRQVNKHLLKEGNRNNAIFYASMKWSKNKQNLLIEDILDYASSYNAKAARPLEENEVLKIAKSVFKYYTNKRIKLKSTINEGAMNFPKISNLSPFEFQVEVKRRQKLAAERTNNLLGEEKKKEIMLRAKEHYNIKNKNDNIRKITEAIRQLEQEDKKTTNVAISALTGISRKTVGKYRKIILL